jgi:hypothetical protein
MFMSGTNVPPPRYLTGTTRCISRLHIGQVVCYGPYITLPRNATATADAAGTRNATGHMLAVAPLVPAWKADDIPDVGCAGEVAQKTIES